MARQVIKDSELRGYRIPAGSNVVMSQWVMHRDSRFFSNPEKFDPDRWNTEQCHKLPKFAYFSLRWWSQAVYRRVIRDDGSRTLTRYDRKEISVASGGGTCGRTSAEFHSTTKGRDSRGSGGKPPASSKQTWAG